MSSSELRRPILDSDLNYDQTRRYPVQIDNGNQQSLSSEVYRSHLQTHEKIFLVVLLLIFVTGVIIGVYLLATEGHERKATQFYNVTSRELWKAKVPSSDIPRLKLPANKVLLLPANSNKRCKSKFHCAKVMQELQLEHMLQRNEPDILYNFIVSQDGNIFEGRGWKFQTTLNSSLSNVISMAFLGNDGTVPTVEQSRSTKLFLIGAVTEKKLESCFRFASWGHDNFFKEIVKDIQHFLTDCKK